MINRILIAEDNFVAQQVLEAMLEGKCHHLIIASNSQEILNALQINSVDLLLLDYHLDRDADVIIPEILSLNPSFSQLPIYILSAEPEIEVKKKLKSIRFDGCIPKPITIENLDLVLTQVDGANTPSNGEDLPSEKIDVSSLEKTLGGPIHVKRIVSVFVNEAISHLLTMEHLLSQKKWRELKNVIHRARAGYGYIGLNQIVDQLKELELLIDTQGDDAIYDMKFTKFKADATEVIGLLNNEWIRNNDVEKSINTNQFLMTKKILLIDDSEVVLEFLTGLLTVFGAEIKTGINGLQAIELTKSVNPDLIVMDVQMPELNGIDSIREIRQAGFKMPIVSMSSSTSGDEPKRAIAAGANDFLLKPIDLIVLEDILKKLLFNSAATE
jgi:CheY-like chemotaxis protein